MTIFLVGLCVGFAPCDVAVVAFQEDTIQHCLAEKERRNALSNEVVWSCAINPHEDRRQ